MTNETPPFDPGCPMWAMVLCPERTHSVDQGYDVNGCKLPPKCVPDEPEKKNGMWILVILGIIILLIIWRK